MIGACVSWEHDRPGSRADEPFVAGTGRADVLTQSPHDSGCIYGVFVHREVQRGKVRAARRHAPRDRRERADGAERLTGVRLE